jgi:hypothetical protein
MKRVLAGVVLLLLLAGCRTETILVIEEDGSGTFTSEVEIENRYIKLLSQEGDPIEALQNNAENVSFPVETELFDTDTAKGLRASFDFSDVDDMKAKFVELNTGQDGSSALFADATIEEGDNGWIFEASQPGGLGAEAEQIISPEELRKVLDSSVEVTLPGPAGDNNATEVSESNGATTFAWELVPGTAAQLSAHTVIPDSLLEKLLGPLGLGILGGLVLIVAAFILVKRTRKPAAETPEA